MTENNQINNNNNVNFREVCMGHIARGVLYRSNYPLRDRILGTYPLRDLMQDMAITQLANEAQIACVLNLADNEINVQMICDIVPWYHKLASSGCVVALDIGFDFFNKDFEVKLKRGIEFMLAHKAPYLIHCFAGMDRTGFVCAILEALMGANLEEIKNDYLLSYNKGFESALNIGEHSDNGQVILEQLTMLNKFQPITNENLQPATERYLIDNIGLTTKQIANLKKKLSNPLENLIQRKKIQGITKYFGKLPLNIDMDKMRSR